MFKNWKFLLLIAMLFSVAGNAGEWRPLPPMPTPRAGASSVVWQNRIYVFGGKSLDNKILNTVDCFDPDSGAWITSDIPPFEYARYNAAAIVFNNQIFLIGGRGQEKVLDKVEVFDPVQKAWKSVHDLHEKREGFTAVVLNNHIYVLGGQEEEYSMMEEVEWYDEEKDQWREVKNGMSHPRVAAFSAAVGDTLYLFGGYYFGLTGTFYKGVFRTNHAMWFEGPMMRSPRAYGITVLMGDSIYLIGGETQAGKTDIVEIYDLKRQEFFSAPPMSMARSGMAGGSLNDSIFVFGGYDPVSGQPVTTAEVYVPQVTAIDDGPPASVPQKHTVISGYPNPFNGQISFKVVLPRVDSYEIALYNVLGKRVKTLFNGRLPKGLHRFQWQGKDEKGANVSSGVFFLLVKSSNSVATYKVVYVQ